MTYICELLSRCHIVKNRQHYVHTCQGLIRLWREVALDEHGRVPRDFKLHTDRVLASRQRVVDALNTYVAHRLA